MAVIYSEIYSFFPESSSFNFDLYVKNPSLQLKFIDWWDENSVHIPFYNYFPGVLVGCINDAIRSNDMSNWFYDQYPPPGPFNPTNFVDKRFEYYVSLERLISRRLRQELNKHAARDIERYSKLFQDKLNDLFANGVSLAKELLMMVIGAIGGKLTGKVVGKTLEKIGHKVGRLPFEFQVIISALNSVSLGPKAISEVIKLSSKAFTAEKFSEEIAGHFFGLIVSIGGKIGDLISKSASDSQQNPLELWDRIKKLLGVNGKEYNVWEDAFGKDVADQLSWVPIVNGAMSVGQCVASFLKIVELLYDVFWFYVDILKDYEILSQKKINLYINDMHRAATTSETQFDNLLRALKDSYGNELDIEIPKMMSYRWDTRDRDRYYLGSNINVAGTE